MMMREPDVLFTTEYIKNVFYFATVRQGKVLKSTSEVHYFCIDNDLVYENYYSDFGPLNIGCVFKYCKIVNEKLKQFLNKQIIVHYTTIDPRKKANAAFLIGCYGVLYLSLTPKDALKPLTLHGQSYRPFQDVTQGEPIFTISLLDCLCAIKKARELDFFNFQDFNYEEYEKLDKIQGGDLNWIVPGKFLAFIGPVDCSLSLHHPPEIYIDYFKENNVEIVVRLNKRMYDGNVFNNAGIQHYDLFFCDGSCPPRHILLKFLEIAEKSYGAIAVHSCGSLNTAECSIIYSLYNKKDKAGLGRTGSLIGAYLIKHYRMTSHEAIGWMRICRPGSVIGQQQKWLEDKEAWLIKQGNLYRKRTYQDTEKFPIHEYGIYSIAEKMLRLKPLVINKSPSPSLSPPPIQRQTRSETTPPMRSQPSKIREAPSKKTEKDKFDWRLRSSKMNTSTKVVTATKSRAQAEISNKPVARRSSAAGEPPLPVGSVPRYKQTINVHDSGYTPFPTFRTTQGPVIKTLADAKNFLLKSSIYGEQRDKLTTQLNRAITVTPHYSFRSPKYQTGGHNEILSNNSPSSYSTAPRGPTQPQSRRRLCLGRSPSPSPSPSPTRIMDHSRATNTSQINKYLLKDSKTALLNSPSRLKSSGSVRGGGGGSVGAASVGAASLGARREAPPAQQRAPSVRSDERPLATQGDLLNSIKFQRRFRDGLNAEKISAMFNEKVNNLTMKDKPVVRADNPKLNTASRCANTESSTARDKTLTSTSKFFSTPRPTSPKGRMRTSFY